LQKIIGDKDGTGQYTARYLDGNVPNVNWNSNDGKMNVNRIRPQNANDNWRVREKFQRSSFCGASCVKYFIQPLVILDIS